MATFAYSGRARGGQVVNGEFMADTVDAAVAALRREQILVTKINPVKDKRAEARRKVGTRSVKAKDLAVFTRQFSVMIGAGLPLVQCLEILGTQAEDKKFGEVILATRADVEAGGILDAILKRLATYIEKAVKLKSQVKSAMVYPVAVIVIATVVVAAILWKVIPTFASLFAGLGADLPLPTRIVIALSDFLVAYMPVIIGTIVAISFALRAYYRTVGGRMMIDRLVLKMPVLGMLMRKIAVARFCRTLSTLLASGVSILEALDITARTAGNAVVEQALFATRKSIEGGDTVAGPLRQTDVFPPMVVQMIGVGEATGALDTMLAKIADFYEDEVDVAVAGLLTLLEPLMISLLGGVVGGIVIAMYLPIFSLISQLTGG